MELNKQDADILVNWIEKYHSHGKDPKTHKGYVRGYPNINHIDNFFIQKNFPYDILIKLEKDIYNYFDFSKYVIKEPLFGWFLSYSAEGHVVKYHQDPILNLPEDYTDIIRINFMLKKPESGGQPIINKKIIEVKENDYWICHASKDFHTSVEVKGNKPRIVLSMGYVLTYSDFIKFKNKYEN